MSSSTIEGGEYHCYIHDDFITSNNEEWYKHMESKDENGKPIHTEDGSGECLFCHAPNTPVVGLPWTRPGTVKGIVCSSCKESQLSKVTV